MARKAILKGGKKDEIISKAMKLFFENGYEGTSIRMIMEDVGGEIGMFYHYFRSKEALFDQVSGHFFELYQLRFQEALSSIRSPEEFVDVFLPLYETSMAEFSKLQDRMHWTMQSALHEKTLKALLPLTEQTILSWNKDHANADLLAAELTYGVSGLIHSESFLHLDDEAKKKELLSYLGKVLGL